MKSWAAYSGLMAGFFYYLAMIAAGGPLYDSYPIYDVYISMFCHGTLYFCGFVTAATVPFAEKEGKKLMLGIAFVAGRALLLRPLTDSSQRLFIYILLDGTILKSFLPQTYLQLALPLYYILITIFLMFTIKVFFRRNCAAYRKFFKMRVS